MIDFSVIALTVLGWLMALQAQFLIGLLAGFSILSYNAEERSKSKFVYGLISVFASLPALAYLLIPFFARRAGVDANASSTYLILWGGCVGLSIVGAFFWLRVGVRKMNVLTHKLTVKTDLERNHKTDIRTIEDFIPKKALDFDPLKYINKDKGIFLGLDENEKPVYIEMGGGTSAPHIQVIGTTGAGKGVSLGVMASQFLERDEAVFFCDPKNDEYAPSVLYASAKRTGKPYYYLNLNRPHGAQFDLFAGATEEEAFELFLAGFSLGERGDASDFYGIADRREAGKTAKLMARDGLTIAEAYNARESELSDPSCGAEKFAGKLREMAETMSINAKSGGVSLEKVVEEGGCVYIVGSMRNDIVKTAQRILLVRLIQLAERRDRMAGELRKVCIVLDEVKYHLSRPALEGLGAARDKGVHLVLAHQSLGDLKDCPKDIDKDAVVDAIVENCKLKICYQVINPDTAEWLAEMSGDILVDDESRNVVTNLALTETVENVRSIRQAERPLMDKNILRSLKKSVAVLYGVGLAKFVSIQYMRVKKDREAIRIYECQGTTVKSAADAIDVDSPIALEEVEQDENPFAPRAQPEASNLLDID